MLISPTRWLRPLHQPDTAGRVLICFPHAGASPSFFRPWSERLGPDVAVWNVLYPPWQPEPQPGDPKTLTMLAEVCAQELEAFADRPVMLFGHSMGATVAWETACRSNHRELDLVVSGAVPPQLRPATEVYRRDDDGLLAELSRLGGTEAALLADPVGRATWLPPIRRDFQMIESYRPDPDFDPLTGPVLAVLGRDDTEAPLTLVRRWSDHTHGRFQCRALPGGHFYLLSHQAALLDLLSRRLAGSLVQPSWLSTP